jgi:uncharacterized membrane protein YgdD (TMEM256/DUF423 family)
MMDSRRTVAVAAALIALATVMGAFGAHALRTQLSAGQLQVYETAVRYHFYHALGLLALGVLLRSTDTELLRWAALLVLTGIVIFSGSLYALSFGAPRPLGAITPLGGLLLIAGWIVVAVALWRR